MGRFKALLKTTGGALVAAAALCWFSTAVDELGSGQREESLEQAEAAVRRACVACYATEGVYPPDLDYLKEHYGLQLDTSEYIVHYHATASNLMPDIAVLPKNADGGGRTR